VAVKSTVDESVKLREVSENIGDHIPSAFT